MKRNIVGTIIVISLIFWIPISCCIHFCIVRVKIYYFKFGFEELNLNFKDKRVRAEQKIEFDEQAKKYRQSINRKVSNCPLFKMFSFICIVDIKKNKVKVKY